MQFNISICNIIKERKKNYSFGIVPSRLLNLHQIANCEHYLEFFFFLRWKISASNWETNFCRLHWKCQSSNEVYQYEWYDIIMDNNLEYELSTTAKNSISFLFSSWIGAHLLGVSVNNLKVVYNTIFSGWPSLHISEQTIIHHKQLITHGPDGFKFIRMLEKQCIKDEILTFLPIKNVIYVLFCPSKKDKKRYKEDAWKEKKI